MSDVLTPEQRRRNMSAIKGKNTKPELVVRKLVHSLGFRFRLHRKDLPGKPDLVFPKLRKIIFVHGCFWHMHDCRYGRVTPKNNAEFWAAKRLRTVHRDASIEEQLNALGWKVFPVWECQIRDVMSLRGLIITFLTTK